MPRQPLYPHIPKSRMPAARVPEARGAPQPGQKVRLRYLPDSPEVLAETESRAGCRESINRVFKQAIARVNGGR